MLVGVALKLVDRRPDVDPLTAAVHDDQRATGASDADEAALEWALRTAEAWGGRVRVVTAGSAAADGMLRDALAAGAHEAVRVDLHPHAESEAVAAALCTVLEGCELVWCGDYSLDRGSGSVPAYLAARLGGAQALGLVRVEPGEPGRLEVLRRLDGGRRERLRVEAPAVLSVEGSTARLRRAPLAASLTARSQVIDVRPGPSVATHTARVTRPFRPRARAHPLPEGETALARIVQLTDAHSTPTAGADAVTLDPPAAAERIIAALRSWGYLE